MNPLSRRGVLSAVCLLCAGFPSIAFAQSVIAPQPLHEFDGRAWSGMTLGQTTTGDIKRDFKTQGGQFVRAEALILTPPQGSRMGIQALTDGRGFGARLVGFRLTFPAA